MGIATASEIDAMVTCCGRKTKGWEVKDGDGAETYICRKLAEKWKNEADEGFVSYSMEQGSLKEGVAIPFYEGLFDVKVRRVGFVLMDDGTFGCSPDGLILDGGIEIKCPEPHTHIGYLRSGGLPKDYAVQVQSSMYATGAKWWKFMSHANDLPPHIVTVERDPLAMDVIAEAVEMFNAKMKRGMDRMLELNGGTLVRAFTTKTENGAKVRTIKPDWDNPIMSAEQLAEFNKGI